MKFLTKYLSIFAFLCSVSSSPVEARIKVIFWNNPTIFYQSRGEMFKNLGFWASLGNAGRAGKIQDEMFKKLTQRFGAQTQQYKVNDPETNKPLPLIFRQLLTGEKSAREVRHAARELFKDDSFITKIVNIIFSPEGLVSVTNINKKSFNLVERVHQMHPDIQNILVGNYEAEAWQILSKSEIGKKALPLFNHAYNSGTLGDHYRDIVLQDPEFLKLIIKKHGFDPSECLFADPDPAIIAAAKNLGMQTYQFAYDDIEALKKQLRQLKLIPA